MAAKSAKGDGKGRKAKAQPPMGRHGLARPARKKAVGRAAPAHARTRHPPKKTHAPLPKKAPSAQPAAGDKTPLRDDAILRPAGQKFSIGKESILSLGELSKPLDKDETLSSLLPRASQRRQPKVLLSREETRPEHEVAYAEEPAEQPGEAPPEMPKKERKQPVPARKKEKRKERHAAARTKPAAGHPEEPGKLTEEQLSVLEKAPLPKGLAQPELKRKPLPPPPPPPPRAGLAPATKPPEPLPGLPTGKTEDAFEDMKRAVLKVPQPAQKAEMPEAPPPEGEMPSLPPAEEPEKLEEILPELPPEPSAEELVESAIRQETPAKGGLFSFLRKRKKEVPEGPPEEEGEPQGKLPLPPELPVEEFTEETIIKAVSEPQALLGEPEEAVTITHDYPYIPIEEEERPHTVVQEEAPPAPEQGPLPKGEMPSLPPAEEPEKLEEGLPRLPPEQSVEELVESATVEGKPADGGLFSFLRKHKKRAPQELPVAGERPEGVLPLPPELPAGKEEETPVRAVQEETPLAPEPGLSPEEEEELPPPPPPLASEEQQQLPEDLGLVKEAETAPTGGETSTEPGFQHTLVFPQSETPALLLPDEIKPDRLERIELLWEEADQLWKDIKNIPEEDAAFRKDLENGIDVVERRHRILMPESEEELEIPDEQELLILKEAQEERGRALEEREKEALRKQAPGETEERPVSTLREEGKWKAVPQEQHLSEIAESVKKAVAGKVAEPEEELPEPPLPNEDEEPIGGFFGEEPPGVIPREEEQMPPQPQLPPAILEVPEAAFQKKRVKEALPEKAAEAAAPVEETLPETPAPEKEHPEETPSGGEEGQPPGGEAEEQPFPADILDITDEMLPSHDKRPLGKATKSAQEFGSFIRKEGLTAEELKGIRAKAGKKHAAGKKLSLAQRRKAAKRERKAASLLAARRRDRSKTRFKLSESKVESILKESGELDVSLKPQTASAGRLPPLVEEAPLEPAEKERKGEARRENADSFEKERLIRAILSESEGGIAPAGQRGGISRKDVEREEKRLQERMAEEKRGKRVEEILNQLSILASTMRTCLAQKDYAGADQAYQQIKRFRDELGDKNLGKLGYELVMLETDFKLARLG